MAYPKEKKLHPDYKAQIENNHNFANDIGENLGYFQRGLYSPLEFLRAISIKRSEAEAFVITPTPDNRYPVSNMMIVRTRPFTPFNNIIEVHDPFSAEEYCSIELAGDEDNLYPAKIFKHNERSRQAPRLITELEGMDYQDGVGVANWFGVSRVLN